MNIQEKLKEISLEGEQWRPCPEFEERYLISSHGRILGIGTCNSCKKGELIKQYKKHGRNGYMQVRLYERNRAKTLETHLLVAKAFIPNPNNLPTVNHIDENKTNNHVENLEWCSNRYNIRYSQAKAIDVYTKEGQFIESLDAIADAVIKYNVPSSNIARCCKSKCGTAKGYQFRYKGSPFVPKPFTEYQRRKSRRGHKSCESKRVTLYEYTVDGRYITSWSCSNEAGKAYGIAGTNIRKCSRGEIATIGGKIFITANESIIERLKKINNRNHKSKSEK